MVDVKLIFQLMLLRENKKEGKGTIIPWTAEEKEKFCEAVRLYGRDWRKVSQHTGKDYNKVNSYAFAFLKKIEKNPD